MQIARNRTMATMIALFLLLTIAVTLLALPVANAHTPAWQIPSYAYLVPAPNPVGVGQRVLIVMWIDIALPGASATNDVRRHNYKLTITKPDKTTETMEWPLVTDSTSIQYAQYTPDQVGTYTLKFDYVGQTYTWSGAYQNDTFAPATTTKTLTVQQEPLPAPINSFPLPTEYWARPIEGQNTDWWRIASNWLKGTPPQIVGRVQPDGAAPNSPHIMWTKPIDDGGIVGGSNTAIEGNTFYPGLAYNLRFRNPIIMNGRLFYELPFGNSGTGGGYQCVDLRTGEKIWWLNTTYEGISGSDTMFGYYYAYEMMNQHGIIPQGWIFTTSFGKAIQPNTGTVSTLNITNVPSGTEATGPAGEILRYAVTNIGNTTHPNWRLTQWNSSNVFTTQTSGTINASLASRYDWNMSIALTPGTWSVSKVLYGDLILMTQGSFGARGDWYGANVTAISLKPASRGQVLWTKHYDAAPGNMSRSFSASRVDPVKRVFILGDQETFKFHGYSLDDGSYLWTTPTITDASDYEWFTPTSGATNTVAYGRFYVSGYGGVLYCYDTKNGSLLWCYGNGGPGNSTFAGLQTAWGRYPLFLHAVADGKLYVFTTEHSPNTPLYKGGRVRCIDAYTGKEIWTMMGYSGAHTQPPPVAVADGFLVYLNHYDMQIYCVGKGPSATTVEAPMTAITGGNSVVIRGMVTDISAGTKQDVQAARFPNGVPAVSDESMSAWMEYVYMQKPCPTNAAGVDVTLNAVDPNGNWIHIGTAASDTSSLFSYAWKTPDIPGKYTVIATFAGSESYWPSYAETAMIVSEAPPATPPPAQPQPAPDNTLTTIGTGIAIIIAVAIVGIMLYRKHP